MKGIFVQLESPQIWTPLNFDTFITVSMNKLKKKKSWLQQSCISLFEGGNHYLPYP